MSETNAVLDLDSQKTEPPRSFILGEANLIYLPWVSFQKAHRKQASSSITFRFQEVVDEVLMNAVISVSSGSIVLDGEVIPPNLPSQFDHDVLLSITDLWDTQGQSPDGKVEFKVVDILRSLKISERSGGNRKLVKVAILRLSSVTFASENAFYSAKENRRITDTFNILSSSISEKNEHIDKITVWLSQPILNNLKRKYVTKIDRPAYEQLNNCYAKRLFNIVTHAQQVNSDSKDSYEFELNLLAQILPIKGAEQPSKIKERLRAGLEELEAKKILYFEYLQRKDGQNRNFLRLIPLTKKKDFLTANDLKRFLGAIYETYGCHLDTVIRISERQIKNYIAKNMTPPMVIEGVAYNYVFYVLNVLMHQVCVNGYAPNKHMTTIFSDRLKKNDIEEPAGWRPVHEMVEKMRSEIEPKNPATLALPTEAKLSHYIDQLSFVYVDKLSVKQLVAYLRKISKAQDGTPIPHDEPLSPRVREKVRQLIVADLRKGVEVGLTSF